MDIATCFATVLGLPNPSRGGNPNVRLGRVPTIERKAQKLKCEPQKLLRVVLRDTSVAEAAILLGVHRATIYRYMDKYGIERVA